MPLPLPNLDDRRWADLVDEGRALIPRYAPDWTDHNLHDPGITLMELFAWLTEANVYRLNRVPDRHRRKFLALIGYSPQSPRAAQSMLTLEPDIGTQPFHLPKGAEVDALDAEAQPVRFRTVRDLTVAVVSLATVQVEAQANSILDQTRDWRDGLPIAVFGQNPQPGAAWYLGFSEIPTGVPVALALHFEGPGSDAEAQPVRFRTVRDLTVAVVSLAAVQVEAQANSILDQTRDWRDGLPIAVFGQNPQPGAAWYLGFSEIPTGVPVALALHFEGPGSDAEERRRLVQEAADRLAAHRGNLPEPTNREGTDAWPPWAHTLPHHSARLVWEVSTPGSATPWTRLEPVGDVGQSQVEQVRDDTRALTLDGIVELNLPPTVAQVALGGVAQPLIYVRCQLTTGAYDAPPLLKTATPNSVAIEQAVPVFQTFSIAAGVVPNGPNPTPGMTTHVLMQMNASGSIAALSFLTSAAAPPETAEVHVLSYTAPAAATAGQITLELAVIGRGTGYPHQVVQLPQAPVQIESFQLYTCADSKWQTWTRRDDFDASRRTDYHFVIDPVCGEVTFGDGERGCVPSDKALIFAAYRTTRAGMGNIAVGAVVGPADTPRNALWRNGLPNPVQTQLLHCMTNRVPAGGGRGMETVAEAVGRAVDVLYAHERLLELAAETQSQTLDQIDRRRVRALPAPTRAVNLLDIERLALDVPGTRVARARAWAGVHPDYPCLQAPGVVTVVIVPDQPVARPQPSRGLLEAVKCYLSRRRTVCTRLEVVGPTYVEVRVKARARTRPHTNKAQARERIRHALDTFLDPRSGGPAQLGWPFGRDVYRSEILQIIDGVPGVDHVLELTLSATTGEPSCGNVSLCPTWLATPGQHQIEVV